MPRFAANLSTLFTDAPFLERFGRAAQAGFAHVECQYPYEAEKAHIRAALDRNGLAMALFNLPPGNAERGDRGLAIFPDRRAEFRQALVKALDYSEAVSCPNLHVMAGIVPQPSHLDMLEACYLDNLRFSATEAAGRGVRILIEPINPFDMPGYFLSTVEQAADIIRRADVPNLYLQYDLYHRSRTGGDLVAAYVENSEKVAHIQIAGSPGRAEPDMGEVDFVPVLQAIEAAGYRGIVGCEYFPAGTTEEGLGWLDAHGGPGR